MQPLVLQNSNNLHLPGGPNHYQVLNTNPIFNNRPMDTFARQQQLCTKATPQTYTAEDADENRILYLRIDPAKAADLIISSCGSCESMGSTVSKAVHGGCIELFRIQCDGDIGSNQRIRSIQLDLRPSKPSSSDKTSKAVPADRLRLLEARIQGNDYPETLNDYPETLSVTRSNNPIRETNANALHAGSLALIKGIKAMADKYQNDISKQHVGAEEEVTAVGASPLQTRGRQEAASTDTEIMSAVSTKPVVLIQPRGRHHKQPSSVQMIPQPKRSKKPKKAKEVLKISKLIGNSIQVVSLFGSRTEKDQALRNPQVAWVKTQDNELTIAENRIESHQRPPISAYRFSNNGEIPSRREAPWLTPSDSRPLATNDPSVVRQNHVDGSIFILYSNEDEKPSPHHRSKAIIDSSVQTFNAANRVMEIPKPTDSEDDWETSGTSTASGPNARRIHAHKARAENAILLNRSAAELTEGRVEESIATAMEALKKENFNIQPTLDILGNRSHQVAAEIELLKKRQEKHQEQDREIDQFLQTPSPKNEKHTIPKSGESLPLAETLNDLIETRARKAPSFEPTIMQAKKQGRTAANVIPISSQRCRVPSEQERLDWLTAMESSSSSTISRPSSASESDKQKRKNRKSKKELELGPEKILPVPGAPSIHRSGGSLATKVQPQKPRVIRTQHGNGLRFPPGFVKPGSLECVDLTTLADRPPPPRLAPSLGPLKIPQSRIAPCLNHPGPSMALPSAIQKSLMQRLAEDIEALEKDPTNQELAEAARRRWGKHINLDYDMEGGIQSSPETNEKRTKDYKLPSSNFTIQNTPQLDFKAPIIEGETKHTWDLSKDPKQQRQQTTSKKKSESTTKSPTKSTIPPPEVLLKATKPDIKASALLAEPTPDPIAPTPSTDPSDIKATHIGPVPVEPIPAKPAPVSPVPVETTPSQSSPTSHIPIHHTPINHPNINLPRVNHPPANPLLVKHYPYTSIPPLVPYLQGAGLVTASTRPSLPVYTPFIPPTVYDGWLAMARKQAIEQRDAETQAACEDVEGLKEETTAKTQSTNAETHTNLIPSEEPEKVEKSEDLKKDAAARNISSPDMASSESPKPDCQKQSSDKTEQERTEEIKGKQPDPDLYPQLYQAPDQQEPDQEEPDQQEPDQQEQHDLANLLADAKLDDSASRNMGEGESSQPRTVIWTDESLKKAKTWNNITSQRRSIPNTLNIFPPGGGLIPILNSIEEQQRQEAENKYNQWKDHRECQKLKDVRVVFNKNARNHAKAQREKIAEQNHAQKSIASSSKQSLGFSHNQSFLNSGIEIFDPASQEPRRRIRPGMSNIAIQHMKMAGNSDMGVFTSSEPAPVIYGPPRPPQQSESMSSHPNVGIPRSDVLVIKNVIMERSPVSWVILDSYFSQPPLQHDSIETREENIALVFKRLMHDGIPIERMTEESLLREVEKLIRQMGHEIEDTRDNRVVDEELEAWEELLDDEEEF
ncbi:hypothetical protein H072_6675 [Dactylellina haptotyla CBS 200.50]|uniref:Uncharacterized protein n=1 Tax=Dactylellina haptotyla (strain CBS 200.50) TaxID=1284197 RepID=S8BW11_DACHA|nr:hypothetical protein H072_6675 [Dactylellina haptotyla CBS 200.50]